MENSQKEIFMDVLYIRPRWWKRRAVRKVLESHIGETHGSKTFHYVQIKKQFVASLYDDGESLKKEIREVDSKAKLEIKK